MKMQEELNKIYARTDMPENEEKKRTLVLHTSEVDGGEKLIKKLDRAREIIKEISENSQLDNSKKYTEFASIIRAITQWLDDNNWK